MPQLKQRLNALVSSGKWNIGYVKQTPESFIANKGFSAPITWLKEDKWDCSADPFVYSRNGKYFVMYEEVRRFDDNGEIFVMQDFDFSTKKKVKGLTPLDIHYSYPFLIEDNGKLFCVPESSAATEVCLYEVVKDDLTEIKKVKTLLHGSGFVDTSIVKYKGLYWLFTICKKNPSELLIFYADRLEGEYIPHRLSPILVDADTSRGAGNIFVIGDLLYRPTQNVKRAYGGSLMINCISQLTTATYESEFLFEVKPNHPYKKGLHQMSIGDGIIVIDGYTNKIVAENIYRKIKRKIKAII